MFAGYHAITQLTVMRDKASDCEVGRVLTADELGKTDTSAHGSIDEYGQSILVTGSDLEERFDQNTQSPHQYCGHDVEEYNGPRIDIGKEGCRLEGVPLGQFEEIMHTKSQNHSRQVGESHVLEVGERGVADDSAIGMEYPEAHHADDYVEQKDARERMEIGCHSISSVEEIVDNVA